MLLIFLPSIILFIFDFLHKEFLFTVDVKTKRFHLSDLFSNPIKRKDHNDYKSIWFFEDVLSIVIVFLSLVLINSLTDYPNFVINITIFATITVLIINSILDYVLNCNYFFFQCNDGESICNDNTDKRNKNGIIIINGVAMFFVAVYAIIKNSYHYIKKCKSKKK